MQGQEIGFLHSALGPLLKFRPEYNLALVLETILLLRARIRCDTMQGYVQRPGFFGYSSSDRWPAVDAVYQGP